MMWPCRPTVHLFPLHLSLRRVNGWIRGVSVRWINFPIQVHMRFTGLFLAVSGLTFWSCLEVLAFVRIHPTSVDSELVLVRR